MRDRPEELRRLFRRLQPICRSITGEGVRTTLQYLDAHVHAAGSLRLTSTELASGTPILDWTVPNEWNIADAFIADASGRRLVDFRASALHVVSYSEAVDAVMSFEELHPHLHSMEDRPSLIPYRTSYHTPAWGFCVPHDQLPELASAGPLTVRIDSTTAPGSMTLGEIVVPGLSDRTIIVSTHTCHPWTVNDNVTGMSAAAEVALALAAQGPLHHTVRFLFLPGTLGSIAWLAHHGDEIRRIDGGLVLTGLGDGSPLTYKRSRRSTSLFDRTARGVLAHHDRDLTVLAWDPYGYDERQFCSPAFDLPVGRLTRGVHGRYPQYHTSADSLEFVSAAQVAAAIDAVVDVLTTFDALRPPRVVRGEGEPQLGRRGLYRSVGGAINHKSTEMAYLWVLSLADGDHSDVDIADASGIDLDAVRQAITRLAAADLLAPD